MTEEQLFKYIFYIASIILMFVGLFNIFNRDFQIGIGYLSIGLASYAIGLSFHSSGIADKSNIIANESNKISEESKQISNESKSIAQESNEKMSSVSNMFFIEGIDIFLNFIKNCPYENNESSDSYHDRNNISKWAFELRKIKQFQKWASLDYQTTISHLFSSLLNNLPWGMNILTNGDVRHLLTMCIDIAVFRMKDKDKKSIIQTLNNNVLSMKKVERYDRYINRALEKIKPKLDDKILDVFKKL